MPVHSFPTRRSSDLRGFDAGMVLDFKSRTGNFPPEDAPTSIVTGLRKGKGLAQHLQISRGHIKGKRGIVSWILLMSLLIPMGNRLADVIIYVVRYFIILARRDRYVYF
jgi:hypothetical protein